MTLQSFQLAAGYHDGEIFDPTNPQVCAGEWFNVCRAAAHPTHVTDECPADVSPMLWSLLRNVNDRLDNEDRQLLKRFLPNAPGAPSPLDHTNNGKDDLRGWIILDWVLCTALPMWLDGAERPEWAKRLSAFPPVRGKGAGVGAARMLGGIASEVSEGWADLDASVLRLSTRVRAELERRIEDMPRGIGSDTATVAAIAATAVSVVAEAVSVASAHAVAHIVAHIEVEADSAHHLDAALAVLAGDTYLDHGVSVASKVVTETVGRVIADATVGAPGDSAWHGRQWQATSDSAAELALSLIMSDVRRGAEERFRPALTRLHVSAVDLITRLIDPS